MSQTITLYVDGACKGNPGLGGWGAYIITETEEHKIYGGELETTNNRMELTAAIEGVSFCPVDAHLIIWTDSNYVKQGITEWIHGWKKKNWKDVKNPDLWKKLDAVCANRNIEWNWIKGHAGHRGNEMADQLANMGAEQTAKQSSKMTQANADTKKPESDWLLDDPFGLDLDAEADELIEEIEIDLQVTEQIEENIEVKSVNESSNSYIVITDAKLNLQGPRQLILDTETTGFYYQDNDRIIEVGAIEMINRKLTGSSIHIYINPEKPVGDSVDVHGITDEFLADKPKYAEIADVLFEFLKGAEIIAHNATFDMNFLDMEFKRAGLPALSEVCEVTDTLALAKNKHPGQKNSLDALVRRYEIPARDRTFHGALLDAEILADVYLAMTGGQVSFDMDALSQTEQQQNKTTRQRVQIDLPIIYPTDDELQQHETWVKQFEEKHGKPCFFAK
ncbi:MULTISPECIES: DNA polymerase III subunit epsilon [Acinetobacter]|uniref:Ribonuclease H n=1 Tax=Acinetobacter junii CIP 107470 = MTCC 11364 TaxID=1217666 RepID=S7Y7W2_ACIJU|nr:MULTISPECIES: DNA polymerase III subunit epsilon [Acinetobacter]AWA47480.1 DNA polymerase III subunit epsilon [Acinetobacter junii]ENV50609.1 DNA polymerase III, epsilon subunit [Acinetobacter junii CIP 107470 = MTCC 11364]EPR87199.1 Ribonuclease HI / DNA polymerase III epsilon subunit [Acinetobacter junii CIP 107470 = MTCC 11364]MDH1004593.1 DNA polymerase III subunit epsilon [Acinetobacter junii]MDI6621293.1 DNA polymerase III subunit epsilon [Acinetobacter junii]